MGGSKVALRPTERVGNIDSELWDVEVRSQAKESKSMLCLEYVIYNLIMFPKIFSAKLTFS